MKPELRSVSTELPDPPYPEETKCNGWRPEFDGDRIQSSETWILADDEVRPWLLMLWLEAWRSVPVGTYPNDTKLIAKRVRCKPEWFDGHSEQLLRGWRLHSDGNLYHPYITGMVINMLATRRKSAERKKRQRKANKNVGVPWDSRGSHAQEQEQEQETGDISIDISNKTTLSRKRDWASVERIFDRLNELTKSNFRAKNGKGGWTAHAKLAMSRIEESSAEESMRVVETMVNRWKGTDKAEYLRPATLFAARNYENYLGQIGHQFERKNGQQRQRELSPYEQRRQRAEEWKRKAVARMNGEEKNIEGERLL